MNTTDIKKKSPLLLVVDDDKFMRLQLRRAMEQVGYQVAEASDGEQALAAYSCLNPDIVLLDALMPLMDGFSCCTQLQTLSGSDRTPILMITALEDQESVDRAFAAGATDYITKPIHWAVLRQRVQRLLQSSWAIEELRQQTERSHQSEAQLRLVLEAAQMGTWDWDILQNSLKYSNHLEPMFGLIPGSAHLTYEAFLNAVHPEDRDYVAQAVTDAIAAGKDYETEFRVIWADGTLHWVGSKGQVYYDNTFKPLRMVGISMDITDRKRSEAELQHQTRRSQLFADITLKIRQSLQPKEILQTTVTEVQQLLQADRVLIYRLCPDGTGSVVTEAVVSGWPVILGQTFLAEVFPEEYRQLYKQGRVQVIEDMENAKVTSCLIEFVQQWGVQAKLVVPILLKSELWGLLIAHQCASPRQWHSFEIELLQQLANQMGIALTQAQLLEEETRRRQELDRSNIELQQFASIASHDLQEPLRKILAFGNRLKDKYGEVLTDQGRDYLDRMQNAASRMQTLIDDLLILSRITTRARPFTTVNLAQVTQDVLSDLEVRIQQTQGRVEVGELPIIAADPLQMRQLLQNLIGNALKFHQDEEPPVVKVYSRFGTQRQPSEGQATDAWQIIVEDNGIGFDEMYLDRIFNVFQRLHSRSEYEGTGVGLAICRKIVERHGGSLTAESKPGRGATFTVTLPITQRQGDAISEGPPTNRHNPDG